MNIHELYTFKIADWEFSPRGILVAEDQEWLLIRNVKEYLLDGYCFINKAYLVDCLRSQNEAIVEQVLRANGKWSDEDLNKHNDIPLDTQGLFDHFTQKGLVVDMIPKDRDTNYVGRIMRLTDKSFYMRNLSGDGLWSVYESCYRKLAMRVVKIDTDYINSLVAYNKVLTE